jgi:hypothetical protein
MCSFGVIAAQERDLHMALRPYLTCHPHNTLVPNWLDLASQGSTRNSFQDMTLYNPSSHS